MKGLEMLRLAKKAGWRVDRIKGSHHILKHPEKDYAVVIPVHKGKDMRKRTELAIIRKLGLKD